MGYCYTTSYVAAIMYIGKTGEFWQQVLWRLQGVNTASRLHHNHDWDVSILSFIVPQNSLQPLKKQVSQILAEMHLVLHEWLLVKSHSLLRDDCYILLVKLVIFFNLITQFVPF